VRITILCENTASSSGLIGEHGFSALIERGKGKILFDTGQGLGLVHNADLLGVDLKDITEVVLSHGHYDHTGGLKDLLQQTSGARITAHPHIFQPKYARRNGEIRYIGIPFSQEALEGWGGELRLSEDAVEIAPGIMTTGVVPRLTPFEGRDDDLLIKTKEGYEEDELLDDLSLIIDTPQGNVVVLGCAHAGLINILTHIKTLTGEDSIHWILGGTHLGFHGPERLEEVMGELRSFSIDNIGVSHCTGFFAGARLAQEMEERFRFCTVGTVIEVEIS
jgi:7,8-dihydropterin-6-yl-methyl-4-(beta-D-ribofuranosyl)aminobenzene 5'-phosphate synthase